MESNGCLPISLMVCANADLRSTLSWAGGGMARFVEKGIQIFDLEVRPHAEERAEISP